MSKAAELAKMGEVLTNSQIGGRRNIIINGSMQIFQRGTSLIKQQEQLLIVIQQTDLDMSKTLNNGQGTMSQSTDTPASEQFQYSLKTLTTAVETAMRC